MTPPTAPPMTGPEELELAGEDSVGRTVPSEVAEGTELDVADEVTSILVLVDVGIGKEEVAARHSSVPYYTLF